MFLRRLLPCVIVLALALGIPMLPEQAVADGGCVAGCADLSISGGCPNCPGRGDRPPHDTAPACAAVCAGMVAVAAPQTAPAYRPDQPFYLTAHRSVAGCVVAPERSPPRTIVLA